MMFLNKSQIKINQKTISNPALIKSVLLEEYTDTLYELIVCLGTTLPVFVK